MMEKLCFSCGVLKNPGECSVDELMSLENAGSTCAICYQIYRIEQDLILLKFFIKDRNRLLKELL